MKTQIKLNVDDELFDKATEEILTAKITEMARNAITDEKIAKIIDTCNKNLSSIYGKYFDKAYGDGYYPTDAFKELLRFTFDSEIHKALSDIINKDTIAEFAKDVVADQVKMYIERWMNLDSVQPTIEKAVRDALSDEIGKLAKQKFNEMFIENK